MGKRNLSVRELKQLTLELQLLREELSSNRELAQHWLRIGASAKEQAAEAGRIMHACLEKLSEIDQAINRLAGD